MVAVADRVKETTTTVGTGLVTLLGAASGFRSFSAAFGAGSTVVYYVIEGGTEWEVGAGTVDGTAMTLSRTSVLASSNAGAAVNFSAGTKNVFCSYPAGPAVLFAPSVPRVEVSQVGANLIDDSTVADQLATLGLSQVALFAPLVTPVAITAVGANFLDDSTTVAQRATLGLSGLLDLTNSNMADGANALATNVSGTNNTAIGKAAAQYQLASYNVALGTFALGGDPTGGPWNGSENVAVGYQAGLWSRSSQSVIIGATAGGGNSPTTPMTGLRQTLVGYGAGYYILNGADNTLIGYSAGGSLDVHAGNVFVGANACASGQMQRSVVIGKDGALGSGGNDNVVVGASAMRQNIGDQNVVLGVGAGGITGMTLSDRCVIIGYLVAASNDPGDDALWIHNSDVSDPLVQGSFSARTFKINGDIIVPSGRAVKFGTVLGNGIYFGAGSPETVVTAKAGSMYLNNSGGAGTTLYIKESGSGNTGWVAK